VLYKVVDITTCLVKACEVWDDREVDCYGNANLVFPSDDGEDGAWAVLTEKAGVWAIPEKAVLLGGVEPPEHKVSEALLSQFFHEFLQSGVVTETLDKLKKSGSFERDGETNVFARVSKSVVDTLAKHWTTTRGAEIVALSVVSTQLLDKQQKHQKFLQFLALSKCHEALPSRQ
nr:hypothetical protein [Tanacetum cinerariifolium]